VWFGGDAETFHESGTALSFQFLPFPRPTNVDQGIVPKLGKLFVDLEESDQGDLLP